MAHKALLAAGATQATLHSRVRCVQYEKHETLFNTSNYTILFEFFIRTKEDRGSRKWDCS